jgi:tripartite ATP-independent transporter DctM subunit
MLAGASLAPIIPPSILAIIIGTLADVSIAKLLMAGILPGLLLSGLFIIYALLRIHFNPSLAPPLDDESKTKPNWNDKIRAIAQSLPFVVIIFSIMGVIFLGIATPSEAAATGVLGALLTAAIYKKLSWKLTWEATGSAAAVGAMVLAIMASSKMFSQILAFTGATKSLTVAITSLPVSDTSMLLVMLLLPFILCMFIDQIALMLVIIPIYEPVIASLGFDPVWFWTLFLINITVGGITPPFGYTMFAFIGAAEGVTIKDVFAASWPFVGLFVLGTAILIIYPGIITYLSSLL